MAAEKVYIVGVGDDGVEGMTAQARRLLEAADLLLGPEACAPLLPASMVSRLRACANLEELVERIESAGSQRLVVLASGDPLFYGTARYVCSKLGKDRFEVVPHVSSMQLAFARVKESWEEAFLANLSGQSIERVVDRIRSSETVGLFTSEQWPPSAVARTLLEEGIDSFQAYVCENLGSPDECVTQGSLADIAKESFGPLNVMILVRKARAIDKPGHVGTRLFGNTDESFLQSRPKRGLLTPAEVRSLALAELGLQTTSIVWDVGAGEWFSGAGGRSDSPPWRRLRHRDGSRRPSPHTGQRRAFRRDESACRLGPSARRMARFARSGCDLRRRKRSRCGQARGGGVEEAEVRWAACVGLQQYRESGGGARVFEGPIKRCRLLAGDHCSWHRTTRPHSLRIPQPDVFDRRNKGVTLFVAAYLCSVWPFQRMNYAY